MEKNNYNEKNKFSNIKYQFSYKTATQNIAVLHCGESYKKVSKLGQKSPTNDYLSDITHKVSLVGGFASFFSCA